MKKYIVYYYRVMFANGGMGDYVGSFDSSDEVYGFLKGLSEGFWEKIDSGESVIGIANLNEGTLFDLWWSDFTLDELKDEGYYKKITAPLSFEFISNI